MKYLAVFLLIFMSIHGFCQDMIIKKSGDTIMAKVLLVTPNQVQYKRYNTSDTNLKILPASTLVSVIYPNGTKYIFETNANNNLGSAIAMSQKGKEDARRYYKKYKGAKAFTTVTSLYPFFGVIPAIVISSTPPKSYNLGYPSYALMSNYEYSEAYKHEAYRIKKKKTWGGVLLGTAIFLGFMTVTLGLFLATWLHAF